MKLTPIVKMHYFMSIKVMCHCDVAGDWIARQFRSFYIRPLQAVIKDLFH
jgi:hypothetical protein